MTIEQRAEKLNAMLSELFSVRFEGMGSHDHLGMAEALTDAYRATWDVRASPRSVITEEPAECKVLRRAADLHLRIAEAKRV